MHDVMRWRQVAVVSGMRFVRSFAFLAKKSWYKALWRMMRFSMMRAIVTSCTGESMHFQELIVEVEGGLLASSVSVIEAKGQRSD